MTAGFIFKDPFIRTSDMHFIAKICKFGIFYGVFIVIYLQVHVFSLLKCSVFFYFNHKLTCFNYINKFKFHRTSFLLTKKKFVYLCCLKKLLWGKAPWKNQRILVFSSELKLTILTRFDKKISFFPKCVVLSFFFQSA